jgi:hypothetical protein
VVFPIGHSAFYPGPQPDGAEFILGFDDGAFDEYNTFNISDWLKHTPNEVLGKKFGVPAALFKFRPCVSTAVMRALPYNMYAHSAAWCQCISRTPPRFRRMFVPDMVVATPNSRALT